MNLEIKTPRWSLPLLEDRKYKGAKGGRGSGKSHFFAELLVEEHVRDQNQDSVCIREIQKSLKFSAKKLIETKIRELGVGHMFTILQNEIKSNYGHGVMLFQGMQDHTADSIKSLEGFKRAWVEEGQSLSKRSIDLLIPTIVRRDDAQVWFSWNPEKANDPVEEFFKDNIDAVVVHVNYHDNPWCPDSLIQEAERQRNRDVEAYAHIWLGQFAKKSEALVFKNWTVESFELPEDAEFNYGADWGYSVDPTTLVRCSVDDDKRKLYVDYEAHKVGCEIEDTPALFDTVPNARKWNITADSARPETISFMKRKGFRIKPAKKGAGSVEDGITFLQSYDIVVHPRCAHTIQELSDYSWKVDKHTGEIQPILEDKDNHVIDALRYALEGRRKSGGFFV